MATIQSTQEPTQQKSAGLQNTVSHHDIIDYHPQASIIDNQPQFSAGSLKHSMHGQKLDQIYLSWMLLPTVILSFMFYLTPKLIRLNLIILHTFRSKCMEYLQYDVVQPAKEPHIKSPGVRNAGKPQHIWPLAPYKASPQITIFDFFQLCEGAAAIF